MNKVFLALIAFSLLFYGCLGSKSDSALSEFQKLPQFKEFKEKNPNPSTAYAFLSKNDLTEKQKQDCSGQLADNDYYQITAQSAAKKLVAFVEYRSSKITCVIEQDATTTQLPSATPRPTSIQIQTETTQTITPIPTIAATASPSATLTAIPATPTPTASPTPFEPFKCSDGTPAGQCSTKSKPFFCTPTNPPTLISIESKCG